MILCKRCLEEKEEGCFNKNSRKTNGKNSYCKKCQSEKNRLWLQENAQHRQAYEKNYKASNKPRIKENKSRWDAENAERRSSYRLLHKSRYASHAMKRYVQTKLAQPSWLSDIQLGQIEEVYWLALDLKAVSGDVYHVDHIIPLQGKTVCGLHVPWNLQVLPADINIQKSNNFGGDV